MRVAFFAGSMIPGQDGVTRVLFRLIDELTEQNIPHMFVTAALPPHPIRSTPMVEVPSIPFPPYPAYRLALPGFRAFEKQIERFAPDIFHINSPCSLGYAAVRYGQRLGIPVVATYHTHFPSYAKYYNVPQLERFAWSYLRRLYNACDRIFVPSLPILRELDAHGIRNLQHLPHGVDVGSFKPSFKSSTWKTEVGVEGKLVVLYVGRLVWEKDLRTLAEAYGVIRNQRQDTALVFVGDGPAREELQTMLPDARFLGHQTGRDLSAAYASSDLFVMPSTTETFGNVTVEAMASGIVPVCAAAGGAAGFIRDGETGVLAAPRDPQDLAAKISAVLSNPDWRQTMAQNAFEFARRQSWRTVTDTLLEYYEDVCQQVERLRKAEPRKAA